MDHTWKIKEIGLLGQICIDLYRYVIGLVGCIAVVGLLEILYRGIVQKDCIKSKLASEGLGVIERFGLHTLEVYVIQRIVLERCFAKGYEYVVNLMDQNILALNLALYDLVFSLMIAVLIGYVLLRISEAISKHSRLSLLLFGKNVRVT